MNDWYGTAKRILAEMDANLPTDADLVTRREACLRAKPWEFATTSWGRKVWSRAQREYLVRYGYVPKTAPTGTTPLLSPLEKAKARAELLAQRKASA
jgi:hypothetical protein